MQSIIRLLKEDSPLRPFLITLSLFALTALAEIVGCYLPWLWLKQNRSPLLLIPAVLSLSLFVWLLTLHPAATGRIYAAYGGVYVSVAILWLWLVDRIQPDRWDLLGTGIILLGFSIMVLAPRASGGF